MYRVPIYAARPAVFWAPQKIGRVIGSLLECSFFLFLPKTIIRNTISTLLELLLADLDRHA
jgi:hypothetical protein